jgi:hypothetical protein
LRPPLEQSRVRVSRGDRPGIGPEWGGRGRIPFASSAALAAWHDITPLARNEFICWVEDAKQPATRERRIRRTQEELEAGQRRPVLLAGVRAP